MNDTTKPMKGSEEEISSHCKIPTPDGIKIRCGDLGKIERTTSAGIKNVDITDSCISLRDGESNNILKRSIVIHQDEEVVHYGDRIACGVIEPCDFNCQQTLMFLINF